MRARELLAGRNLRLPAPWAFRRLRTRAQLRLRERRGLRPWYGAVLSPSDLPDWRCADGRRVHCPELWEGSRELHLQQSLRPLWCGRGRHLRLPPEPVVRQARRDENHRQRVGWLRWNILLWCLR